MNLTDQVVKLITAYGSADVDKLMPHLTCTRQQARRALENAAISGFLKAAGARGTGLAVYSMGPRVKKPKPEKPQGLKDAANAPRFASVWAYGAGKTVTVNS